jgi:hypothetical protein
VELFSYAVAALKAVSKFSVRAVSTIGVMPSSEAIQVNTSTLSMSKLLSAGVLVAVSVDADAASGRDISLRVLPSVLVVVAFAFAVVVADCLFFRT